MRFRIKDLKEFLDSSKINWLKIVETLNKKSFESYLKKEYLEVEILPNRFSDSGNIRGLAKEISLVSDIRFKDLKFKLHKVKNQSKEKLKLEIKTKELEYYSGRLILDIENKPSPKWLKDFLNFYKINSINFLVDLSNYVMIKIGAPLHIFDFDKINDKKIIVRDAKEGESFVSLKNNKFVLSQDDIVISDNQRILALAGIQGGKYAEVDLKTKNIFVESAVFNNFNIYRTSRKLNLITDSSYRFERRVSIKNSQLALDYFCYLVEKELKGKVIFDEYIYQQEKKKPEFINLRLNNLFNYTSLNVNHKDVLSILKKLNCRIIKDNKTSLVIQPPNDRLDLALEVDLIEEIIRLIGYDSINPTYPLQFNYPKEDFYLLFYDYLRNLLAQLNFTEILSYSFIDDNDIVNFKNLFKFKPIEIVNPNSNIYKFYRPFIFINLLKGVAKNLSFYNWLENKEFKFFEIGKIAFYEKNEINELSSLALVISLDNIEKNYLKIKGLLKTLFEDLGIENYQFNVLEHKNYEFEFISEILIDNKKTGYLLMPTYNLLKKYNIEQSVVIAELNLNFLINNFFKEKRFKTIFQFPAIFRDVSLVVPIYFRTNELEKEIRNICRDILERLEIIDIYYINDQEKSITFHLVFRNKKKTLRDEEINELMDNLIKFFKDKFNIKLR
ncbi:MAG: phenylalanine--tRNA ligase beta subunit [Candidatus Parcubacteria bacterium]|nr:MAG: phenylalanine--tRNA ligase beta subunit [Candidatus Parcubacteria bacterium]